jgi:flagellar protein FlaJ
MFRAKQITLRILELIKEIEVYENYKESLAANIKKIDTSYQRGSCGYLEYQTKLKTTLRNRSRQEWVSYYNSYIYSLLKKIDYLVSEVYSEVQEAARAGARKAEPLAEKKGKKETSKKEIGLETKEKAIKEGRAEKEKRAEAVEKAEEEKADFVETLDQQIRALRAKLKAPREKAPAPEIKAKPVFGATVEKLIKKLEESREARRVSEESRRLLGKPEPSVIKKSEGRAEAVKAKEAKAKLPELKLVKKLSIVAAPVQGLVWGVKSLTKTLTKVKLPTKVHAPKPAIKKEKKPVVDFSAFSSFIKKVLSVKRPAPKPELKKKGAALPKALKAEKKASLLDRLKMAVSPKKKGLFVEEIVEMERAAKKEVTAKKAPAGVMFGWFFGRKLLQDMLKRFRAKQEPIMAEKIAIPPHVKKLREMRAKLYEAEHLGGFEVTLLAQEAKRVRMLMEKEKPEIYKGSSIGLIANVTVKKTSLWLVSTFPEFFGFLYNALRAANIKILSNTYVNIMILCTISLFFGVTFFLSIVFFILNHPLYQIALRSLAFGLVAAGMCATIFYIYPFMRIKERRRSMTTNMPFAINHIASVAASGVPPATMLELISQSKEYGEVAVEIKKIVDFINIFGYDLLTALRSVAATTPSVQFKEFLEGMVSTIETGGDLESYLKQKAEESTTTYQLERQRYSESISTYSDIYTGLLIAAPLFFIAALSLINLLGGSLGGLSVDVVMALAAYLLIPALNIGFIIFLQISQPEA